MESARLATIIFYVDTRLSEIHQRIKSLNKLEGSIVD